MHRRRSSTKSFPKFFPSKYFVITTPILLRWLLFFLILGLPIFLFRSGFFSIKSINCQINNDHQLCPETVLAELNQFQQKSILTLNLNQIKQKIITANPQVNSATIDIQLPRTLNVTLFYQPASFAIKIATDSAAFITDKSGNIISLTNDINPQLSTIITPDAKELSVGQAVTNQTIISAFNLASTLKANYINFDTLIITDPETITVVINPHLQALFSPSQDVETSVTSLQLILSKATIPLAPRIIDLRFDKPVLKY